MATKGKPMSWKAKAVIAFVVLFLAGLIFTLTPWGFNIMRKYLDEAYEEAMPAERRTHWSADWWLTLAWWEGTLCGRREMATKMYQEFLGILPPATGSFRDAYLVGSRPWKGKFDPKTHEGWGILHERAPEAYLAMVENESPYVSKQETCHQACFYVMLFHDLYGVYSKTSKPHPKFYVYWPTIEKKLDPRYTLPNYKRPEPRPPGFESPPAP